MEKYGGFTRLPHQPKMIATSLIIMWKNTWSIGTLARTAGTDRGAFRQPMMADPSDKKIYEHEIGFEYGGLTPFAETGPIMLGTGDNVISVTEMIPRRENAGRCQRNV